MGLGRDSLEDSFRLVLLGFLLLGERSVFLFLGEGDFFFIC